MVVFGNELLLIDMVSDFVDQDIIILYLFISYCHWKGLKFIILVKFCTFLLWFSYSDSMQI